MRAAYLTEKTGAEGLVIGDVPKPSPDAGELLIHVRATAVTPTELQWYPTFNTRGGEPRPFPVILSHELSGVVADIGSGVTEFKAGDAVYGMNDWFANGAQAEFCTAPAVAVAPKPATLDFAEAAVVPISALTAWQGLFDHGGLKAGERVLIHGGSGGVGVFAVQLARWRGAEVVATASAERLGFVRELGADEAIDYKTTRFEEVARNIDLVLDSIGGETLERSWKVLRPGGRAVTIASQSAEATDARTKAEFFIVEPNPSQLTEIARLLDSGAIRAFVEAVYPLDQAREAYARAVRGNMRGKIALRV